MDKSQPTLADLIDLRLDRRGLIRGAAALAAASPFAAVAQEAGPSSLTFKELAHTLDDKQHVADGYDMQVLIRWGDPVMADAPAFNAANQTAAAQEKQFGYNNDYLGLYPLPYGSKGADRFLLVANHEYVNPNLMFAGLGSGRDSNLKASKEQAEVLMAAVGGAVIEIVHEAGAWKVVAGSKYARRLSANTAMEISGPAAGHDKLKTNADPGGRKVFGTFANCAGGSTPWGTWLTCEENFHTYFGGDASKLPDVALAKRYGLGRSAYGWDRFVDRFNTDKEPNEPNRFGWVVEIDPYEPQSVPVKRTALGRFCHEGCTYTLAKDGRVVFYSGDDARFEYVYKFVTARPWNPTDRVANKNLLDEGTLSAARFEADGKLTWLPLVHGQGPLTAANGFADQGDVVINARRAADLVKATPMDRPEDIETNPVNGRVYVVLTNNGRRKPEQVDKANPRAVNDHGHILELAPKDGDHGSAEAAWSIFLLAGKPGQDAGARYHRATSDQGWLSCPDNIAFDSKGRIWIVTDGAPVAAGVADGVYGADTMGYGRALTRCFYQAPTGAEVCGPIFTPDDRTFFLAVQHPGEDRGSTFEKPSTRWPDFKPDVPPRPAVVAITRKGGGPIGS
ncbi:MAG: PhoX family phosphatase [Alphaproteobacteria bacterium]|nr:MAG: PhoX family phosphatase [Alphaproteobacteria bacterium]